MTIRTTLLAVVFGLGYVLLAAPASASIITYDTTGRLTVVDPNTQVYDTGNGYGYTPTTGQLTYNSATGAGTYDTPITVPNFSLGQALTIHDLTFQSDGNPGSTLVGSFLGDLNANLNMPGHITWNATGGSTAVYSGLMQVGDVISGDVMTRGALTIIPSLGSVTPYADTLNYSAFPGFTPQGPAPMAATNASLGFDAGTALQGYVVL